VAEHFGLDGDVGGIAPGRFADLLILPDARVVHPEVVVARGRVVARDGRCLAPLEPVALPPGLYAGPRVGPVEADAFRVAATGSAARVRVIRTDGQVRTFEDEAQLAVRAGAVEPDAGQDVALAAVLDRRGSGRRAVAFVRGFGLRAGALASTVSFDTADLVAVGTAGEPLAAAVERVVVLGGGLVAVDGAGLVRAEVPLPVGGFASPRRLAEIADDLAAFTGAARALGCHFDNPLLPLETLTFQAIPALRLTAGGLLDVKSQRIVPMLY
jgi:adenine deaminase